MKIITLTKLSVLSLTASVSMSLWVAPAFAGAKAPSAAQQSRLRAVFSANETFKPAPVSMKMSQVKQVEVSDGDFAPETTSSMVAMASSSPRAK